MRANHVKPNRRTLVVNLRSAAVEVHQTQVVHGAHIVLAGTTFVVLDGT